MSSTPPAQPGLCKKGPIEDLNKIYMDPRGQVSQTPTSSACPPHSARPPNSGRPPHPVRPTGNVPSSLGVANVTTQSSGSTDMSAAQKPQEAIAPSDLASQQPRRVSHRKDHGGKSQETSTPRNGYQGSRGIPASAIPPSQEISATVGNPQRAQKPPTTGRFVTAANALVQLSAVTIASSNLRRTQFGVTSASDGTRNPPNGSRSTRDPTASQSQEGYGKRAKHKNLGVASQGGGRPVTHSASTQGTFNPLLTASQGGLSGISDGAHTRRGADQQHQDYTHHVIEKLLNAQNSCDQKHHATSKELRDLSKEMHDGVRALEQALRTAVLRPKQEDNAIGRDQDKAVDQQTISSSSSEEPLDLDRVANSTETTRGDHANTQSSLGSSYSSATSRRSSPRNADPIHLIRPICPLRLRRPLLLNMQDVQELNQQERIWLLVLGFIGTLVLYWMAERCFAQGCFR